MEPPACPAEPGVHGHASETREARRLARILAEKDLYVALFRLKRGRFEQPVRLDGHTLERLAEYIERYTGHAHIIDTRFSPFMNELLKKVRPSAVGPHVRCLSYLEGVDLDFFRRLYGYGKIYRTFKEAVAGLFSCDTPSAYLTLLIRLLENNQLVYKSLLPVISRIRTYAEKDVVDRNIGACCAVLNAVARCCPEYFNEVLTASLIDYLARLLHTPQNYLFLAARDIAVVRDTLETLGGYTFRGSVSRNNAIGLLRECIGKVVEYRSSTVVEERQVVVRMAEILPVIFNICLNQGQRSFSFIDPGFLDLELAPGVDGQSPATRGTAPGGLRTAFIEAKYRFLDCADAYISGFERGAFYRDLAQMGDVTRLFAGMPALKRRLDWGDLITYACRSSCKPSYMPVLFDDCFMAQPRHIEYVCLFLKSISGCPEYLIYFARIATDKRCDAVLMELYLLDRTSSPMAAKVRSMVLQYLSAYQTEDGEPPPADERYLARLKRRLERKLLREERDSGMDRMVADCIARLTFYEPCAAVAALFTVFISKSIRVSSHVALYGYMQKSLAHGGGDERAKIGYVCLSATILVRSGTGIFDVLDRLESYYDGLIAFLSYRASGADDAEYRKRIEQEGFRVVFGCTLEQLDELGAVSGSGGLALEESVCWREYGRINALIEAAPGRQGASEDALNCGAGPPSYGEEKVQKSEDTAEDAGQAGDEV